MRSSQNVEEDRATALCDRLWTKYAWYIPCHAQVDAFPVPFETGIFYGDFTEGFAHA